MKEIKIKISDDDYKRFLRIASLDAVECGDKSTYGTEEKKFSMVEITQFSVLLKLAKPTGGIMRRIIK